MLNDEGAWRTEWMRWGGCSQLNSKQGENFRGSRVTVLGEPGIRVSWCWNTGCWNEKGEVRCSQDGEWVMRWNGSIIPRVWRSKPEWMKMLSSQSAIYNISVRKAQFIYNLLARRWCTKHVKRNTGRYLVFCILVLSLLLCSIGSGITFITFATFILLLGWGDQDFLYRQVTERVGRAVGITFITDCYWVGN